MICLHYYIYFFNRYDRVQPLYSTFNGLEHQLQRAVEDGHIFHRNQGYPVNKISLAAHPPTLSPIITESKEKQPCTHPKRIVFLKTHKTASSTTASILQRFGFSRNWTFAVGKGHVIARSNLIRPSDIYEYPGMGGKTFDILTNHARYNRETLEMFLPGATYVTILRKPEDQLESAFSYFGMYRGMQLKSSKNPLKSFMEDPYYYYKEKHYFNKERSRNGQLYDLGFDHRDDENETRINMKIDQLDKEFDLVMITEYFDESLILLKKQLCLDYDDIVYISKGVRRENMRFEKNEDIVKKMKRWNHGDYLLYQHFNETFWKKIKDYGPSFEDDKNRFRRLNEKVLSECVDRNSKIKFYLKNNTEKCETLRRSDSDFTKLIKKSMAARFGKHV